MDNSKFTEALYQVVKYANAVANKHKLKYVGTEHIVYAILSYPKSDACSYLIKFGASKDRYFEYMQRVFRSDNLNDYTIDLKHAFEVALEISNSFEQSFVSTEHMLLAILYTKDCQGTRILNAIGVQVNELTKFIKNSILENAEKTKKFLEQSNDNNTTTNDNSNVEIVGKIYFDEKQKDVNVRPNKKLVGKASTLSGLGYDLTERAERGMLDPVIGRDDEIARVIQTLSRRTKNNPILIGEPGVGKSAVVEGIAELINVGKVPEFLYGKRIFSLDIAGLISGTIYRGELEEKFKDALDYIKSDGNIILYIDEIHNIVDKGQGTGTGISISEMLKPILARGELPIIGATTIDEYRKFIEKDSALERRFQPITIEEPSIEDAVEILMGLKPKYEAHHKVEITDEAVISAVKLSARYVSDRFLPDKAIDIIDECASKLRISATIASNTLIEYEKELKTLKLERDYAISRGDGSKIAETEKDIQNLNILIEKEKNAQYDRQAGGHQRVTDKDVAKLISSWTGIPIDDISEGEGKKLLELEKELHALVIGQDNAVSSVARAIRRARARLKDPNKPVGSFIFVGPTGVGKTELAKALAKCVFGSENSLITFDMSEYSDKTSVNKLLGSAPGYVGYDEEGQLSDKIRRKPYSVVLFDEIEKAHSDVYNIFLQILDEGRVTDSKGRELSFKNSIIIMTSNVGFGQAVEKNSLGFGFNRTSDTERAFDKLKGTFPTEFLNRIDDIIIFDKLTVENCKDIALIILNKFTNLALEQGYNIVIDNSAVEFVIEKGYSDVYGARPIKRTIEKSIEDLLSEAIIIGGIKKGDKIIVYSESGEIKYKKV